MGQFLNNKEPYDKYRTVKNGPYFVDKSEILEELIPALQQEQRFFCITRPRRFGKTIMANMIAAFFENTEEESLFDDLYISRYKHYKEQAGRHDVIYIDFSEMPRGCRNYQEYILRIQDGLIRDIEEAYPELEIKSDAAVWDILSHVFDKTGDKFVFVMDEWDAVFHMSFITEQDRENFLLFLKLLLKGKSYVELAYMTGVLPIAKYSDGSELNMFLEYNMATRVRFSEYFGFSDEEVDVLYDRYLKNTKKPQITRESLREWYDGYHFGDFDVYCPWDVMNYLLELQRNPKAKPVSYWKNTSDNAVIRSFIDYAGGNITGKLETLLAGGTIVQRVDENLTYDYLHSSENNLWSMLYLTGYLTKAREEDYNGKLADGTVALMIPNAEIKEIFETTVVKWFDDSTKKCDRSTLFDAVWNGDSGNLTKEMNVLLRRTISYHDYKEDFYHAFLAGIFTGAGYMVDSNKEHGEGRSDVVVYDPINSRVAIFEAKYTKSLDKLESECDAALQQIDDRMYAKEYEDDYDQILCYGISFFKKRCMVKKKLVKT